MAEIDDPTRQELHQEIDSVVDNANRENQRDEHVRSLDARIAALEGRGDPAPFDPSPITSRIDGLESNIDRLVGIIESGNRNAQSNTQTKVKETAPSEPETPNPLPVPDVQASINNRNEIPERPPRTSHALFWRIGRRT